MQVIFQQQRAGVGELAGAVLRDQRLEIRATAQRGMWLQPRMHAEGRGFDHRGGNQFIAHFGDGLFEKRVNA